MAMDDLFDSGIDDGAATGSVDQPPSEVVHEELEVSSMRISLRTIFLLCCHNGNMPAGGNILKNDIGKNRCVQMNLNE